MYNKLQNHTRFSLIPISAVTASKIQLKIKGYCVVLGFFVPDKELTEHATAKWLLCYV